MQADYLDHLTECRSTSMSDRKDDVNSTDTQILNLFNKLQNIVAAVSALFHYDITLLSSNNYSTTSSSSSSSSSNYLHHTFNNFNHDNNDNYSNNNNNNYSNNNNSNNNDNNDNDNNNNNNDNKCINRHISNDIDINNSDFAPFKICFDLLYNAKNGLLSFKLALSFCAIVCLLSYTKEAEDKEKKEDDNKNETLRHKGEEKEKEQEEFKIQVNEDVKLEIEKKLDECDIIMTEVKSREELLPESKIKKEVEIGIKMNNNENKIKKEKKEFDTEEQHRAVRYKENFQVNNGVDVIAKGNKDVMVTKDAPTDGRPRPAAGIKPDFFKQLDPGVLRTYVTYLLHDREFYFLHVLLSPDSNSFKILISTSLFISMCISIYIIIICIIIFIINLIFIFIFLIIFLIIF